MAIKPAVNRRISELKGYYEVLGKASSEARKLGETYEKEKTRIEEDFTSNGLVSPDENNIEAMKDEYLLAEDRVKSTKEDIAKVMASIKKDAEKLRENCKGIKEETETINQMREKLEKDKEIFNKKIESKRRRLELLSGAEKNKLQEEIDNDINKNEESFKSSEEDITKKEKSLKNLQDAKDSYDAYRIEYNKYAIDKLPEIGDEHSKETPETETPGTETPETETPGTETPGTETPETEDKSIKDKRTVGTSGTVEKEELYEIKTKKDFEKAYRELKDGQLSREKRDVLYSLLEDKSKFDELGITTGIIFNKAKYILKAQGKDLKSDIGQFIKGAGGFSDDIGFDSSKDIRNNEKNMLSTKDLSNWRQLQDLSDGKTLSVEKYIEEIETAKLSGMDLSEEQEKMYKDAVILKDKINGYRGGLDNYSEVKAERSIFMEMDDKKKLSAPESREDVPPTTDGPEFSEELGKDVVSEEELSKSVEEVVEAGEKETAKEPPEDMTV